jgi:hypothetical protein
MGPQGVDVPEASTLSPVVDVDGHVEVMSPSRPCHVSDWLRQPHRAYRHR